MKGAEALPGSNLLHLLATGALLTVFGCRALGFQVRVIAV